MTAVATLSAASRDEAARIIADLRLRRNGCDRPPGESTVN
jgi:hypothetical protein